MVASGQGDHPGLVAFAGQDHLPGSVQAKVAQFQCGDLPGPGGGVIEQDEQHPVAAAGVSGKDRPHLILLEVFHRRLGDRRGLQRRSALV